VQSENVMEVILRFAVAAITPPGTTRVARHTRAFKL
jgi:hypothetical protein